MNNRALTLIALFLALGLLPYYAEYIVCFVRYKQSPDLIDGSSAHSYCIRNYEYGYE